MLRFGDLQAKGNGTHGRYRMDFEDFERKVADNGVKLFLLCNPHNPVGRAWRRGELERVAAICERHGVIVASDEIHEDFARPGHEHVVYASVSESAARSCIVCTAPSKTFNLAGLQTSNVFIPNPGLRKRFKHLIEDEAGLWLDMGTMFGEGGSGFVRVNIVCPRSTLEQAFAALARALSSRR